MRELPKIVAARLQASAVGGVHPDPELLTAFAERALNQQEQADVVGHLAACGECREILALALPEQIDVSTAATTISPSGRLSWSMLRWGAVAACVVVVGAAVTLHYESFQTRRPAITAPANEGAVVQGKKVSGPTNESANHAAPVAKSSSRHTTPSPGQNLNSQIAENGPSPAQALRSEPSQGAAAAPLLSKSQPPDEMIPGRAKDESGLSQAAKTNMTLSGGIPSRQMMASSAMMARATAIPANAIPRWTLTPDGMLQRSIDSGKTWQTILVASPGALRALTANAFDIWVGGGKGALYHSIDAGQHWMQVQPIADGVALQADIIGIEFPDLMHGTLTTIDNHIWITADAGQTWTKQ